MTMLKDKQMQTWLGYIAYINKAPLCDWSHSGLESVCLAISFSYLSFTTYIPARPNSSQNSLGVHAMAQAVFDEHPLEQYLRGMWQL